MTTKTILSTSLAFLLTTVVASATMAPATPPAVVPASGAAPTAVVAANPAAPIAKSASKKKHSHGRNCHHGKHAAGNKITDKLNAKVGAWHALPESEMKTPAEEPKAKVEVKKDAPAVSAAAASAPAAPVAPAMPAAK